MEGAVRGDLKKKTHLSAWRCFPIWEHSQACTHRQYSIPYDTLKPFVYPFFRAIRLIQFRATRYPIFLVIITLVFVDERCPTGKTVPLYSLRVRAQGIEDMIELTKKFNRGIGTHSACTNPLLSLG